MSTMGTFDAFTSARLGIYAAQHGLRVTGNNISNINTSGYTRQRLDQVSFKAGAYDMYRSQLDNHVGSGALVMNINQVRDPYLDVRYRNSAADVGYHDTMLSGIKELADILDEVGKGKDSNTNEKGDGLITAQLQAVADALRKFEKEPTKTNNDLVRNAASTLCQLFKTYSDKLDRLYKDTEKDLENEVTAINECLTNIRDLNREIRDCEIYGDNALELRDERNRQIDELSQYIHVKVVYTEEDIGSGQMVEKLSIYLDNDNPDINVHTDEALLVDGVYGAQFYKPTSRPKANPDYDPAAKDEPGVFLYVTDKPLINANGNYVYKDKDGNLKEISTKDPLPADAEYVMQGTNDPTKAAQVEGNDHYFLQISKLLDINKEEWTHALNEYTKLSGQTIQNMIDGVNGAVNPGWTVKDPPQEAIYGFKFSPAAEPAWADGNEFQIGNTKYTIGKEITAAKANDPVQMAEFIKDELHKIYSTGAEPKFNVTIDPNDNTNILFTAQTPGALKPGTAPNLSVKSDPAGKLSFDARQVVQSGRDATYDPPDETRVTDPVTGLESITSYEQINGVWNQVVTTIEHTFETALDDNDLFGGLQATRELLTEAGEFTTKDTVANIDENAAKKRGITYYQKSLDLLAQQFAKQYNLLNQGYAVDQNGNYLKDTGKTDENGNSIYEKVPEQTVTYYVDADGNYVGLDPTDPNVAPGADGVRTATLNQNMSANDKLAFEESFEDKGTTLKEFLDTNATPMGGPLFSNRNDNDDETGITAANISVSHSWSNGSVEVVPKFTVLFDGSMGNTTQNTNAGHMVTMTETNLVYDPRDLVPDAVSSKLFQGNFNEMFNDMGSTLGENQRAEEIAVDTHYTTLVEIDTSRDGVSGVDLNDEAMNMLQFQKAMNAAMRLMTAIDEALDRLINNTGVAGR